MTFIEQGLRVSQIGRRYLIKKENIDAFIEQFEEEQDLAEIRSKVLSAMKNNGCQ